jgi:hypothetical protein
MMMSSIALRVIVATAFIGCFLVPASTSQVYSQSGLLARYSFNGNGKDDTGLNPDFDLVNTEFVANTLYLNGLYEHNQARTGYRAIAQTSRLNYQTFSIVLRFKLAKPRKGASQPNLITGGTSFRWFGIRFSDTGGGKLIVYFNNGDTAARVEGTVIRPEVWTVVVCTVDLPNHRVVTYQDGKNVGPIDLPNNFELDALKQDFKGGDKVWSFTDYSDGDVFHGWVDDLAVYGSVLTDDDVARLTVRR